MHRLLPFVLLLLLAGVSCQHRRKVTEKFYSPPAETTATTVAPNPGTDPTPPVEEKGELRTFRPLFYFQYERAQVCEQNNKKTLCEAQLGRVYYNQMLPISDTTSPVGGCWISGQVETRQTILLENSLPTFSSRIPALTIEVALKLDPDSMDTYRMGFADAQVVVSPMAVIFALIDSTGHPDKNNRVTIYGNKAGGLTDSIYDGNWHHFAFVFSGDTAKGNGLLEVWVDGKTSALYRKRTKTPYTRMSLRFITGFMPKGHSTGDCMDELAVWEEALPYSAIARHNRDFKAGKHYAESLRVSNERPNENPGVQPNKPYKIDTLSFAPGYPEYSVPQLEQLQSFPLPRFQPGSQLQRNFPWFDFIYTSYDYSQTQTDTSGTFTYPGWNRKAHALAALALDTEMYYHWHYIYHIPSPTFNIGDFTDGSRVNGRLTKYADQHPEIQTSTILFWTGLRPDRAGFKGTRAYIKRNASINPCDGDTLFPDIAFDGITQRKNLEALIKLLPHRDSLHKIDFINENGEVFGDSRTPNAEGYRGSNFISCIQTDSATARADRARWQYRVFSTYTRQFVNTPQYPPLLQSKFTFYQVAGFMPQYYAEYTEMRKINARFHGMYYSTPDFYPGTKTWNLWETHGPYHGLDVIKDGRKYEISKGDNYFSPFICAGWGADSMSFRPAEWLAATKALAMMGAEFFYPAYFNTVNPAKKQPQDPRGYIYQVAMPVYAQAVTSRYEDLFFHSKGFVYARSFNKLAMYRKDTLRPVYAVYAAVFSDINYTGEVAGAAEGQVDVDGNLLRVKFLPQGATYLYDRTDTANVVFYQLDGWHETTHPYYWRKDFVFEAELCDDSAKHHLRTERPAGATEGDYTNFTTYVRFNSNAEIVKPLQYNFEPRANDTATYYIWICARSAPGSESSMRVQVDKGETYSVTDITSEEFRWYCVSAKGRPVQVNVSAGKAHSLFVFAGDKSLQIDQVVLSRKAVWSGVGNGR